MKIEILASIFGFVASSQASPIESILEEWKVSNY